MAVTFTESAAKRIAAAVRKVERTPQDMRGDRTGSYDTAGEFWAILLGSDMAGRYTFNRVSPDPSALNPDAFIVTDVDAIRWGFEGDAFINAAREANGNRDVRNFKVVRMSFAGYDPNGEPVFVFFYPATEAFEGGLPPHDHRDNFAGGFAFAVHHPGTAVPQTPYAI